MGETTQVLKLRTIVGVVSVLAVYRLTLVILRDRGMDRSISMLIAGGVGLIVCALVGAVAWRLNSRSSK